LILVQRPAPASWLTHSAPVALELAGQQLRSENQKCLYSLQMHFRFFAGFPKLKWPFRPKKLILYYPAKSGFDIE
jgi:hypothetical protein